MTGLRDGCGLFRSGARRARSGVCLSVIVKSEVHKSRPSRHQSQRYILTEVNSSNARDRQLTDGCSHPVRRGLRACVQAIGRILVDDAAAIECFVRAHLHCRLPTEHFEAVDAGLLSESWRLRRDAPGYGLRRNAEKLRKNLAGAKCYAEMPCAF